MWTTNICMRPNNYKIKPTARELYHYSCSCEKEPRNRPQANSSRHFLVYGLLPGSLRQSNLSCEKVSFGLLLALYAEHHWQLSMRQVRQSLFAAKSASSRQVSIYLFKILLQRTDLSWQITEKPILTVISAGKNKRYMHLLVWRSCFYILCAAKIKQYISISFPCFVKRL